MTFSCFLGIFLQQRKGVLRIKNKNTSVSEIKSIIVENIKDIAFLVGNGINRYPNNPSTLSWDELLIELWDTVSSNTLSVRPEGISNTEFYDILELENAKEKNLQKEFCNFLSSWQPLNHHLVITDKIKEWKAPLLTTNFDKTLKKSINDCLLLETTDEGFTDYYPWSKYHGVIKIEKPTEDFGIWYINGMPEYSRSIRLGLTHYMGSVQRARKLIHEEDEGSLFRGKNQSEWKGHKTWLHIIFNKSLFVFGLRLEESEVFLRWLLIERAKYFNVYPGRKYKGWYLMSDEDSDNNTEGKRLFLEAVGFKLLKVPDYKNIYEDIWA